MQSPSTIPTQPSFIQKIFSGWLAKALTISFFVFAIMTSFAFTIDLSYQNYFANTKKIDPSQALAPFTSPTPFEPIAENIELTKIQTPTTTQQSQITPTPTIKITQSPRNTATNTPIPTHAPNTTSTPTNIPQATNTNSPTPTTQQIAGCFVIVSGYVYNMQTGIGVNAIDPNTGKTHIHTSGEYHCGTQDSPTDMTAIYLDKHIAMGCAARLSKYIVNPPAPADPSCD